MNITTRTTISVG